MLLNRTGHDVSQLVYSHNRIVQKHWHNLLKFDIFQVNSINKIYISIFIVGNLIFIFIKKQQEKTYLSPSLQTYGGVLLESFC